MDMNNLSIAQLQRMQASILRPLQYCRQARTKMFKLRWPHDELWTKVGRAEDALDDLYATLLRLEAVKRNETEPNRH